VRHIILSLIILIGLTACDKQVFAESSTQTRIWGFVQLNVPHEMDEIETYYYYGLIDKHLFHKIADNEINSGFIMLKDVKYWGNDDIIHEYKDGENSGEIMFRIEDIRKIKLINKAPVAGQGEEQFESTDIPAATPSNDESIENVPAVDTREGAIS